MPKLPFTGFPGAAHYLVRREVLTLRYRLPEDDRFRSKASPYRADRNERRPFFEWARKFLFAGGREDYGMWSPAATDAEVFAKLDQAMTLAAAGRLYLQACEQGNAWMRPKAATTMQNNTRPMVKKFTRAVGGDRLLATITRDEVANFVRKLGGKKETKQRKLSPLSNMFTWAIREGHIQGPNPARDVVFWREEGEQPHDGLRKSYTDDEFARLVEAASGDPLVIDAAYLCRYLALRPHEAASLRWEHWKWDQLLVAVPRTKTRSSGVEISYVDLHPVLVERFRYRRGEQGYCLEAPGRPHKIAWPTLGVLTRRIKASNQSQVARELGVSVQALRKHLMRDVVAASDASRRQLAQLLTKRVARVTREAGLYERGVQPLYVLRHSFASDSLRRGTPVAVVAKEMGIAVDTLMAHYFHAIPRGELDNRRGNRWGVTAESLSPKLKVVKPA